MGITTPNAHAHTPITTMQLLKNLNAKEAAGLMSLMASFVFTGFAMYVEPTGEIHDSVIWLVGELLSFSTGCFVTDYFAHRTTHKHKNPTPKPKGNGRPQDNAQ